MLAEQRLQKTKIRLRHMGDAIHIDHHVRGIAIKAAVTLRPIICENSPVPLFAQRPRFPEAGDKEPQEGEDAHDARFGEDQKVLVVHHVEIDVLSSGPRVYVVTTDMNVLAPMPRMGLSFIMFQAILMR